MQLKLDPGSKVTGIALLQGEKVFGQQSLLIEGNRLMLLSRGEL
jgi:hypothetical protein